MLDTDSVDRASPGEGDTRRGEFWLQGGGFLRWMLAPLALLLLVVGGPAKAPAAEPVGRVLSLPAAPGAHWVWVGDTFINRTALFDVDTGGFLGMLTGGKGITSPLFSRDGREIYLAETHYARGTRGARTDVVTIYDARSLRPVGEVVIPAKRAEYISWVASSALSDDGRFLAVFNLTPASSLSIVDLEKRRFVAEVTTPGCGLVYAAPDRRFTMLCGDGTMLAIALDEEGREASRHRSERFFDVNEDPVTEKGVRLGATWIFVSYEGVIHGVDVSDATPSPAAPWSLLAEADRRDSWRVGGAQHLAVHAPANRLYALMHQGGPDTHKQAGTEVWVYDLETRQRIQRFEVRNPSVSFLREILQLGDGGFGSGILGWLIEAVVPNPGADRIHVTQDEEPVLLTSSSFPATVSVLDARTGEFLRDLDEVGFAGNRLQSP